jgi:chromosome segregation ATPase
MNAVISRALSQTAAQQNQQRSIILREQQAVDRGIELNRMEIPNLTAAAAINKAGVEDTTKLKATVTDLQKQITGLVSANQGLQSDLKSTTEQNIELKTQLTKFTTLLTQFHDEVQQVSESIPELQKVDMNISASVDEFKESAEKVTSGFSQILAQLTTHATTIDSLTSKKEQLEKQLSELQALVVSLGSSKAAIEIENIELKGTNERLDAINQSFVKLTAKLEADRVDLEARKRQFEEQYGKWGDHLGKLSIVTQKLEQAASSSHSQGVDAYLQQNSEDIKAQLAKLKQDEEV